MPAVSFMGRNTDQETPVFLFPQRIFLNLKKLIFLCYWGNTPGLESGFVLRHRDIFTLNLLN
jgi:hypothetical protein